MTCTLDNLQGEDKIHMDFGVCRVYYSSNRFRYLEIVLLAFDHNVCDVVDWQYGPRILIDL